MTHRMLYGSFRFDLARYDVIGYGIIWFETTQYYMIWHATPRYGMIWYDVVCYGIIGHDKVKSKSYDMLRYDRYGAIWYDIVWFASIWFDLFCCLGMTCYGMTWYGIWHDTIRCVIAKPVEPKTRTNYEPVGSGRRTAGRRGRAGLGRTGRRWVDPARRQPSLLPCSESKTLSWTSLRKHEQSNSY